MVKSLQGIAHYPLGIGSGNFEEYSGTWREVHVAYLQIAVEGGICAFLLYVLFFGRGFGNLKRLRRMPSYDPEIDLFSGALYATLIGFIVGAFFAPAAYQYFPYFAVAYTSVLLAIAKEREQSEVPQPDVENQPQRRSRAQARAGQFASVPGGPAEYSRTPAALFRNQR
jgi:O-antigen ligase